jgi:hypothetical protein
MNEITRRLSVSELSEKILEMAKTGIYRESVFEALRPLATKQQIRTAITHAKRFGLHSVASLRDRDLGTYYQLDLVKYQENHRLLHASEYLGKDADLLKRVTEAQQAVRRMLALARGLAIVLGISSLSCALAGERQISVMLLSGTVATGVLWALQQREAVLPPE